MRQRTAKNTANREKTTHFGVEIGGEIKYNNFYDFTGQEDVLWIKSK